MGMVAYFELLFLFLEKQFPETWQNHCVKKKRSCDELLQKAYYIPRCDCM